VYLSSGLDITLAYSNCDEVYYGPTTGYWSFECAVGSLRSSGEDVTGHDQSQLAAVWRTQTGRYVSAHRERLPVVVAARVGRAFGLYKPLQQVQLDVVPEGRDLWVARTGLLAYFALALASVIGWRALGRQHRLRWPLLIPFVIVVVSVAMTFGATRYRVTAEPVLCVLAAVGLTAIAQRWEAWRSSEGNGASSPS